MIPIQLRINTREIYTCEFTADGAQALAGAQKNLVQLWNVNTGSCVRDFAHPGSVWAMAWSSDQEYFLSVDGTLRLWERETEKSCRPSSMRARTSLRRAAGSMRRSPLEIS